MGWLQRIHCLAHTGILSLTVGSVLLFGGSSGGDQSETVSETSGTTLVLYSGSDPAVLRQFDCLEGSRCEWVDLDGFTCEEGWGARPVVVVTGHSLPPTYLGRSAGQLAEAVGCFEPELVVLDTCHGLSEPLLGELALSENPPLVLGTLGSLPPSGFHYGPDFFLNGRIEKKVEAVSAPTGLSLSRWRPELRAISGVRAILEGWDQQTLRDQLRHIWPNLVEVPLPDHDLSILAVVEPEMFEERTQ